MQGAQDVWRWRNGGGYELCTLLPKTNGVPDDKHAFAALLPLTQTLQDAARTGGPQAADILSPHARELQVNPHRQRSVKVVSC